MHHWPAALVALFISLPAFGAEAPAMKYPAWEGQWRNPKAGQHGNPWDITKPMGLGQQAPLTPEYQAILEQSLKDQKSGGQGNSGGARCAPTGMPKMMSLAEPMEIFITPGMATFVPEALPARHIYTDGRDWPKDAPPAFIGTSLGKWLDEDGDGTYDVLEIETRNFKGPRVYESTGLPLHYDNQSVVKERMFLDKNDPDILHDEVTVFDHGLTRPWTVLKTYVRVPQPVSVEYNCHASNSHVTVGKEDYFLGGDDKLMPVRVGQGPPDLEHFK